MAMYIRQLSAIEDTVVMMPSSVVCQPAVSITEEGHRTTLKLVVPIRMRHTPNSQKNTSTAPDTTNPATPPATTVRRTVIEVDTSRSKLTKSYLNRI